jgi:hypothetical protein
MEGSVTGTVLIMALIGLLVVVIGVLVVIQNRKQMEIRKELPGYPKGHWMGQGIAIGIAIGCGTGVAIGNIAIGAGLGIAIGVAIGSGLEKKHSDEIRPLTDEEIAVKKRNMMYAIGIMVLGMIAFMVLFFSVK